MGAVANDLQVRRVADVSRNEYYVEYDAEMRSELCVPLMAGDELYGVINAESKQLDAFTEEDERLLSTFAGQLGVAINNLRLFETIAEALAREQHVNEITRIISSNLDTQAILEGLGGVAASLVGADEASIGIGNPDTQTLTDYYFHNLPEPAEDTIQPKGTGRSVASISQQQHHPPGRLPKISSCCQRSGRRWCKSHNLCANPIW